MTVRLGVQDRLVPGSSLREKYDRARRYGFDAIELSLRPVFDECEEALSERIPVSAICGGYRGWLIDPDTEQRRLARSDLLRLVELAARLETGCVVIPIWGRTRNLPGIGTGRTPEEDAALFVDAMRELATRAEDVGSDLYLEPINRYQNDVCVTVADALRLSDAIASRAVRVMVDAFHMNIEEVDLGAAATSVGTDLGYVHLADNHRLEPGTGHLDLLPLFRALAAIGYSGYASFELAGLSGAADAVLPRSVAFVRDRMKQAGLS